MSSVQLPPVGTVLRKIDRATGAVRCEATVVENGVLYRGIVYGSISGAAKAAARDIGLAATSADGFAFFGLKSKTSPATWVPDRQVVLPDAPVQPLAPAGVRWEDLPPAPPPEAARHVYQPTPLDPAMASGVDGDAEAARFGNEDLDEKRVGADSAVGVSPRIEEDPAHVVAPIDEVRRAEHDSFDVPLTMHEVARRIEELTSERDALGARLDEVRRAEREGEEALRLENAALRARVEVLERAGDGVEVVEVDKYRALEEKLRLLEDRVDCDLVERSERDAVAEKYQGVIGVLEDALDLDLGDDPSVSDVDKQLASAVASIEEEARGEEATLVRDLEREVEVLCDRLGMTVREWDVTKSRWVF